MHEYRCLMNFTEERVKIKIPMHFKWKCYWISAYWKKNPLELVRLVFPIKKQARYSQENLALIFWEIDGMHLHNMIFPRNWSPKKKEGKRYVTTSNNTDLHQQGLLQLGILKRRFVVSRALHVLARRNSLVLQLPPLLIITIKKKRQIIKLKKLGENGFTKISQLHTYTAILFIWEFSKKEVEKRKIMTKY